MNTTQWAKEEGLRRTEFEQVRDLTRIQALDALSRLRLQPTLLSKSGEPVAASDLRNFTKFWKWGSWEDGHPSTPGV